MVRDSKLDSIDSNGMTFLHHLAEDNGTVDKARGLVKKLRGSIHSEGAQAIIDALDNRKRSALCIAIQKGNKELSSLLVDEMSPEAAAELDEGGWSCLAFACHYNSEEVALKLIEKLPRSELFRKHRTAPLRRYGCGFARGNAVHNGDELCGGTPMHFAVRSNSVRIVEALLEHYEEEHLEIGDSMERPAEALAALRGHDDLVRLLWDRAPLGRKYWSTYLESRYGGPKSCIREFFPNYRGALQEELWERLVLDAKEGLLRELLCCAVRAKSPDKIAAAVSRLSQAAIDMPLPDGVTAAKLCTDAKQEVFLPLLQKSGPKSAAC